MSKRPAFYRKVPAHEKTAQARSKKHRSVQACEIKMLPEDYLPAEKRPGEKREAIARAD
jgi:hypothetical protein